MGAFNNDPADIPSRLGLALDHDDQMRRVHAIERDMWRVLGEVRNLLVDVAPVAIRDAEEESAYTTALGTIQTKVKEALIQVGVITALPA